MSSKVIIGVPSKGRLMEDSIAAFNKAGLSIEKNGDDRIYRGIVTDIPDVEVEFLSASEIARHIQFGRVHIGITGEDLIREQIPNADDKVQLVKALGFGHADVIVAVPECWIDVDTMSDLEDAASLFARAHGRRLKIATKYPMLTRSFFAAKGVSTYRTVESLGATEGAPAGGTAEAIVDITSTGATLKANGLKILSDGLILKSQANLVLTKAIQDEAIAQTAKAIASRFV